MRANLFSSFLPIRLLHRLARPCPRQMVLIQKARKCVSSWCFHSSLLTAHFSLKSLIQGVPADHKSVKVAAKLIDKVIRAKKNGKFFLANFFL